MDFKLYWRVREYADQIVDGWIPPDEGLATAQKVAKALDSDVPLTPKIVAAIAGVSESFAHQTILALDNGGANIGHHNVSTPGSQGGRPRKGYTLNKKGE